MALAKQLRLVSAELATLAALDLRERQVGGAAGQKKIPAPGVASPTRRSLDARTRSNLSRGSGSGSGGRGAEAPLEAVDQGPAEPAFAWDNSLQKWLDEADARGPPAALFAEPGRESPTGAMGRLEELLGIDEAELKGLDDFYHKAQPIEPEDPGRTKERPRRVAAMKRVERLQADAERLVEAREAFAAALAARAPGDPTVEPPVFSTEVDAIFSVIRGELEDPELLGNIERLNKAFEAEEAVRNADVASASVRGPQLGSASTPGSGPLGLEEPHPLDAPDLDLIMETLAEDATRPNGFSSLGPWTQLEMIDSAAEQPTDFARIEQKVLSQFSAKKKVLSFEQLTTKVEDEPIAHVFAALLEMQAKGEVVMEQSDPLRLAPIKVKKSKS